MKLSYAILLFLFFGCTQNNTLKVATSSNMQFAMTEIVANYEKEKGIKVDLILGSSGNLTSQIEHGAPFDVFVSADVKYPKYLYQKGFSNQVPKVYAVGQLVLWSLKIKDLTEEEPLLQQVQKIAIANPKIAPYGEASIAWLKNKGLYNLVQSKLVYGESVSQCNQFVSTRAVEVGITSFAVVKALKEDSKGYWKLLDKTKYPPILQGAILINSENKTASDFYRFLFSKKAQGILSKYGYLGY